MNKAAVMNKRQERGVFMNGNEIQHGQPFPEYDGVLQSESFSQVRRRIFRQLIESLLFEGIMEPEVTITSENERTYVLQGMDEAGNAVYYQCQGKHPGSFGRIRLTSEPVKRIAQNKEEEAHSLTAFLLETSRLMNNDSPMLSLFIEEINQTLLKDAFAQFCRGQQPALQKPDYDELEGDIMDGHPYHPCYKSRIGFDLADNCTYGPEFKPVIQPVWVAVKKEEAKISAAKQLDHAAFLQEELGEKTFKRFVSLLTQKGRSTEEYTFIPIHPWQWREQVSTGFIEPFSDGRLIYLGEGEDLYRPQQSIRTLANYSFPKKAYIKLPLSITNTSTGRILAQHTILNAARLSDWLGEILESDSYLKETCRLILLKEILGVTYDHQSLPDPIETQVYGTLGAIWRESLHSYLEPGEEALPFNALATVDINGKPFIDPWVRELGISCWLKDLLQVSIVPLIHLLYKHGVAMESHAQNMILIQQEGRPSRIALKDFHDGLRFSRDYLRDPDRCPNIVLPPGNHPRLNRNSFIELRDPTAVKDFFQDAFFFINLGELAFFLEKHYSWPEEDFWALIAEIISDYQSQFPGLEERFAVFNLFSETMEVEQLTKRRLFAEEGTRSQPVQNPLYAFRQKAAQNQSKEAGIDQS
ncbi:IucA/IucC family protein [Pseudobacillus badius]|uniref:IucA/IucC family protein n=2 Tax=Bacillus badius TaxID=1455 RepID=UPI0007B4ED08|nr:IucA/IucC family protein [Bacillus badius]KZN98187.1 hypothetical protein A4244_10525 [Bacillus badius]KZR58472.1 hypothetical protein A3781_16375 [Bacillus badius]MED0666708.1 IucA/IucC family protein [Bacillus badius]